MRGIGPAVMGVLAVKLFQMTPHALPDIVAVGIFIATIVVLLASRLSAFKVMFAGAVFGVLKNRLFALPVKTALGLSLQARS
jgi:chromate transporter